MTDTPQKSFLDLIDEHKRREREEQQAARPQSNGDRLAAVVNEPYVAKATEDELASLAGTASGRRNDQLNICALKLARLPGMDRQWLHDQLVDACHSNGSIADDGQRSVEATIRSAFDKADRDGPREIPEPKRSRTSTPDDGDQHDDDHDHREAEDGAALLDDLRDTLTKYVVFPDDHASAATALWIATTHALPAFECAPRLVATSPDKRCGKSRLLDIINGTSHRSLATVNASTAAVFRSIGGQHPPTLIIDEADTIFGSRKVAENNEDLRALLNAGHQRGRPALRCVGPDQTPTPFPTFAMAALAGIGRMPDTITDRAINITMRRRATDETVSQFRSRRDGPLLEGLRKRLAAWAIHHIDTLSAAEPSMPVEDRAADTWEPLIAVADAAGAHWPATARAACTALTKLATDIDDDQSVGVKLLADVQQVFAETCMPFLPSVDLVTELRRIEDSPWNDFDLTPRKLALRLKDYGIKPGRAQQNTVRGYWLEAFDDAFRRYLRPQASKRPETTDDQYKRVDTLESMDTYKCPPENKCPDENAGQTLFEDTWTLVDAPPAVNGSTPPETQQAPGGPTVRTPGQTDRMRRALANAHAKNTNGEE